ncbi:class I SAM-dependent methyltransferase [Roseibium sp. SCP14]|uniref:class I SAM-dependent methyltransferase n=1 Tax=Roseibium sp. SCP14 TaxID=3141375 RepID=UPI00333871C8
MTTDFDKGHLAEQYKKVKEQQWRSRIETYSLMKLIGDVSGKKVLDVACGEGHFTRILRRAGASKVVGVDISERMIELARDQEAQAPTGIEYRVEDARSVVPSQEFDLVVAAWLLVYARDRTELARMCRGLASRLKPGGRFVTFTTNPGVYDFRPPPNYKDYGFDIELADQVCDGAPITWSGYVDGSRIEVENYYLPVAAYEAAFSDAGFHGFTVHAPELSPSPDGSDDREYWRYFLEHPPTILIDCVKD